MSMFGPPPPPGPPLNPLTQPIHHAEQIRRQQVEQLAAAGVIAPVTGKPGRGLRASHEQAVLGSIRELADLHDPYERLLKGAARIEAAKFKAELEVERALRLLAEVSPEVHPLKGYRVRTWDSRRVAEWFAAEATRRKIPANGTAPWTTYGTWPFGRIRIVCRGEVPAWAAGIVSMHHGGWLENAYITTDGALVIGPDSVEAKKVVRSGQLRFLSRGNLAVLARTLGWS